MNSPIDAERVLPMADLDTVGSMLRNENGRIVADYAGLQLRSHFQPIFSVAHSRTVGYEALLRATDRHGNRITPLDVFRSSPSFPETLLLDRVARALHVQNFQRTGEPDGWLFLNVDAQVFLNGTRLDDFCCELLGSTGIAPHRVVLEVLEQGVVDEPGLAEAVRHFREKGFLIALDDFGAWHSNFDRIWSLQPDIVKLDRSMIARAGSNLRIRRMMPLMVSLLHEAGSLVLMEGIETATEALIAMDADADFVQGYYFAAPAETLPDQAASRELFDRLWMDFREITLPEGSGQRREADPYRNAIGRTASLLESGMPFEKAATGFLELPGAERCYLLDREGRQVGDNVINLQQPGVADLRFLPLADAKGANWSRRFYFRRALEHAGKVQVTRPYLSIAGANQCITVSIGIQLDGEMRVLCGDVSWRDRGAVRR